MKIYKLFLIVGLLLFSCGMVLYISSEHNSGLGNVIYQDSLTKSDAEVIIKEKVSKVISVYELVNDTFNVENQDESDYYKVLNYEDIVDSIYSDVGIKELESTLFNKKEFVKKDENGVFLLKSIPEENRYIDSDYYVDNIKINGDIITGDVTVSLHGLNKEVLTYYLYVKNIKLVKNDNNWLVDSFVYNN